MENGVVKEFDSVPSLMGRAESTFKSMVRCRTHSQVIILAASCCTKAIVLMLLL